MLPRLDRTRARVIFGKGIVVARAQSLVLINTQKHLVSSMVTIKDIIEEWIQIRSMLQKQLKALESGQLVIGSTTEATKIRLKRWIDELNALLKAGTHES